MRAIARLCHTHILIDIATHITIKPKLKAAQTTLMRQRPEGTLSARVKPSSRRRRRSAAFAAAALCLEGFLHAAQHFVQIVYDWDALRPCLLNSTLYHYPLPNIDDRGKVCWGNVALPRLNPSSMWNAFVTSEFNQDYDNRKSQAHPYNVVSQLKDVAQSLNTVYPEQDLVSTNLTLAALAPTNSQQSSNF